MSPEQLQSQATGKETDGRSDIFSFGLVLYEMLTGKRAIKGSSPASVIAAIMERPAPSIADVAPPALDHLLKTCPAKDPDERWQSARDLKRELEWIASASAEVTTVPTAVARRRLLPWIAAAVALGATAYWRAREPASPRIHSFVLPPEHSVFRSLGEDAGPRDAVAGRKAAGVHPRRRTARSSCGCGRWTRRPRSRSPAPKGRTSLSGRRMAGGWDSSRMES